MHVVLQVAINQIVTNCPAIFTASKVPEKCTSFFKLADYEALAKCPAFLKPHSLGLTLHFPSACLIVYAVQLPMKGSPAMHFSYSVIIAENVFPYKNTNQFSKIQDFNLFIFDKLFLKAEYGMWSSGKNWNIS